MDNVTLQLLGGALETEESMLLWDMDYLYDWWNTDDGYVPYYIEYYA